LKSVGGSNPLIWFRLHPRKTDNSGWWYYKGVTEANVKFSIHPKGKSSVNDMGIIVVDNICWAKMAEIIRSSKMSEKIKAEVKSKGFLSILKKDYHKIRMIGQLTIE
jgi:hypothetical protein